MDKLIENLTEKIKSTSKKDRDEKSWGYEEGILISANEAIKLLSYYDFYKGVMNTHGIENNADIVKLKKKLKL